MKYTVVCHIRTVHGYIIPSNNVTQGADIASITVTVRVRPQRRVQPVNDHSFRRVVQPKYHNDSVKGSTYIEKYENHILYYRNTYHWLLSKQLSPNNVSFYMQIVFLH